jgi:hypothetical protein
MSSERVFRELRLTSAADLKVFFRESMHIGEQSCIDMEAEIFEHSDSNAGKHPSGALLVSERKQRVAHL